MRKHIIYQKIFYQKKSILKKATKKSKIIFENRKLKKIDQVTPAKERASARRPPVLRPGDLWGSFRDVIRPERPSRARTPRHVHVSARKKLELGGSQQNKHFWSKTNDFR